MAKIQFTFAVSDIKGKYAGSVFKGSGSGSSVQAKTYGRKKQPARLFSAKSVVGRFSQQWKELNEETRNEWRQVAAAVPNTDGFGSPHQFTGFQLYMKQYINRYWYTLKVDPDLPPGYNPPAWRVSAPSGAPEPITGTVGYYADLGGFLFDLHGTGTGHEAGILGHVTANQLPHLAYRKNGLRIWGATSWFQELTYPQELDRGFPCDDISVGDCVYIQLTAIDLIHFSSTAPRIFKVIAQNYF